jgi:copper chaperone CopZ
MIPDCGFECSKCIQEIESTLTNMKGVNKVYIEKDGEEQRLIVEHNPNMLTVEQLIEVFKGLPSFYKGKFIPILIRDAEEGK